jgi:hypothetical protein
LALFKGAAAAHIYLLGLHFHGTCLLTPNPSSPKRLVVGLRLAAVALIAPTFSTLFDQG